MALRVLDVMTTLPAVIGPETSAAQAARMMADLDVGSLPIVEDSRLVGVITDRDLAVRILAEGRDPQTPVGEICTSTVVTVAPAAPIDVAAQLLARNQLRRLPVVEGDRLLGIISQADLARHAPLALTGSVVERVSRAEARGRDAELDQTLADSFPASDPPPMR
jgi:CBS domain-containing protein